MALIVGHAHLACTRFGRAALGAIDCLPELFSRHSRPTCSAPSVDKHRFCIRTGSYHPDSLP